MIKLNSPTILKVASIAAYGVALVLPSVVFRGAFGSGPEHMGRGYECLTVPLDQPQVIIYWLANPILWLSWLMPRRAAFVGLLTALLAMVAAITCLTNGDLQFATGALVWIASITLSAQAHLVNVFENRKHKVRLAQAQPASALGQAQIQTPAKARLKAEAD